MKQRIFGIAALVVVGFAAAMGAPMLLKARETGRGTDLTPSPTAPNTVRAKFRVTEIAENVWAYNGAKKVTLQPQYDTSIPEDQRFFDATPSGEFTMQVNNPAALETLALGKYFYIDLTPAE